MSFARNFRMGKEGKYNLNVRAEFQNVFNRHFFSASTINYPKYAPDEPQCVLFKAVPRPERFRAGFGYVGLPERSRRHAALGSGSRSVYVLTHWKFERR